MLNNDILGEIVQELYHKKELKIKKELARELYLYSTAVVRFKSRIFVLIPVTWKVSSGDSHEVIKVTDLVFDVNSNKINGDDAFVMQSFYFLKKLFQDEARYNLNVKEHSTVIKGDPNDFYDETVICANQKQADLSRVWYADAVYDKNDKKTWEIRKWSRP